MSHFIIINPSNSHQSRHNNIPKRNTQLKSGPPQKSRPHNKHPPSNKRRGKHQPLKRPINNPNSRQHQHQNTNNKQNHFLRFLTPPIYKQIRGYPTPPNTNTPKFSQFSQDNPSQRQSIQNKHACLLKFLYIRRRGGTFVSRSFKLYIRMRLALYVNKKLTYFLFLKASIATNNITPTNATLNIHTNIKSSLIAQTKVFIIFFHILYLTHLNS